MKMLENRQNVFAATFTKIKYWYVSQVQIQLSFMFISNCLLFSIPPNSAHLCEELSILRELESRECDIEVIEGDLIIYW